MLFKGEEVNNDDVGKSLLDIIDEIYVSVKLCNDHINHQDVLAIIGLWEQWTGKEDDLLSLYKQSDVSGLMEDLP